LGSVSLFQEMNTSIEQGCSHLIKTYNKDIYLVTKDIYFTQAV